MNVYKFYVITAVSKDGETIIHNDMTYSLRHVEESWIHLLKAGKTRGYIAQTNRVIATVSVRIGMITENSNTPIIVSEICSVSLLNYINGMLRTVHSFKYMLLFLKYLLFL